MPSRKMLCHFLLWEWTPPGCLAPEDLAPNMQGVLDRLAGPLHARRAVICITERWRATLPSVQRGFSPEFINKLEKTGAGEYICELTYRRGGVFTFRNVAEMTEPLPAFPAAGSSSFVRCWDRRIFAMSPP